MYKILTMTAERNKEINGLLLKTRHLEAIVKDLDDSLNKVFCNYLLHSCLLSTYIYCGVKDNGIIEANLLDHLNEFKSLCHTFSMFKQLKSFLISSCEHEESGATFDEDIEFTFNYEDDQIFINRKELENYAENFVKTEKEEVNLDNSIRCERHESFENLKKELTEVNHKLRENDVEINNLKSKIERVEETIRNLQIVNYCDISNKQNQMLHTKHENFKDKYYHKYVLKKQETFNYDHGTNATKDCAVCLEDFENEKSVTKLRCGHLFCTVCIEKWLAKSITCPCCRTNPK